LALADCLRNMLPPFRLSRDGGPSTGRNLALADCLRNMLPPFKFDFIKY
jgi:hypothetical protein